ncbi:MAG: hypothetical protein MUP76_04010 [Acidimicrobiia bacterium]|nr:hypothetical protein [Acidimicrobiia bacterium]
MRLNAPKKIVFLFAIALIVIGVAVFYLIDTPHYGFWTSTIGGLLLAAGSYFKGF